ncbi:nucleotide sugar dehydrogenase [Methanobrevibacter olleyae]|uniref:UDP-N-acetyl-D-mannosamine dehydrogenase n=1 Tax=Methanobrevibacter olleyae TaxID=294671 RepID=A0A126R169_METOL|nr:nucleotide sugar dehydrogenase [Methanobrevibacter olleyae]AMK16120.1 UDP-N-acetyl-D-mannosaminuronate dehydrogenase [Methanobrevibacter olleyae]SFL32600.1 UDP-N-acetyl-D-mannosaminuronic acid dehydrogenase [Methanobrevibacter olleyae]
MKICIVGQGYIGLPTAALFAKNGCEVLGVDVNEEIVKKLNQGIAHIEEPGISDSIKNAVEEGHYHASSKVEEADTFIITVPTPYLKEDLSCDLTYVISACKSILDVLKKGNIVIIESTIAPMSTDEIIKPIFEKKGFVIGKDLFLAHCPERVLPGQIMEELVNNNRIVGGITEECSRKAADIYRTFVKGEIIETEAKTAELSKCMENTFRDVNIALANELAKIGAEIGVNALDVIEMANKHPRVNIHSPGPGVGGHCLAIDPYFIYAKAPDVAKIIKLARDTNNSMPGFVIENTGKILSNLDKEAKKISVFGVAYKGNTDDARESPAFEIITGLKTAGYEIAIHDPHFDNSEYLDFDEAIKDSSLILILTDHDQFKDLDYDLLCKNMKTKIIFDTKNIIKEVPEDFTLINYGNLYKFS